MDIYLKIINLTIDEEMKIKIIRYNRKVYYAIWEVQYIGPPYKSVQVVYLIESVMPRRKMEAVCVFCQASCPG